MAIIIRKNTIKVLVGNVQIGHQNRVVIQSMTNTKTSDISATVNQIKALVKNGAELVRVAVLDNADANALKQIVKLSSCPIIADIHYNNHFAITAIESGVGKIRINPANIKLDSLKEIVEYAKKHKTAIRIGINQGSRLNNHGYKNIKDMVNCALSFIRKFESWNFKKIIVSLKSSDPLSVIELYELAAQKIKYPLHLGVTEAGTYDNALIKSTLGLSPLLLKGIGDTIRISITGNPIIEPIAAKKILNNTGLYRNIPNIISCPTCGRLQWNLLDLLKQVEQYTQNINKHLSIVIMGCAVNGIGECEKANIGIYGNKNSLVLYKNGKQIKNIPFKNGFSEIKKLIQLF